METNLEWDCQGHWAETMNTFTVGFEATVEHVSAG